MCVKSQSLSPDLSRGSCSLLTDTFQNRKARRPRFRLHSLQRLVTLIDNDGTCFGYIVRHYEEAEIPRPNASPRILQDRSTMCNYISVHVFRTRLFIFEGWR